jgi:hypothetical protein
MRPCGIVRGNLSPLCDFGLSSQSLLPPPLCPFLELFLSRYKLYKTISLFFRLLGLGLVSALLANQCWFRPVNHLEKA